VTESISRKHRVVIRGNIIEEVAEVALPATTSLREGDKGVDVAAAATAADDAL